MKVQNGNSFGWLLKLKKIGCLIFWIYFWGQTVDAISKIVSMIRKYHAQKYSHGTVKMYEKEMRVPPPPPLGGFNGCHASPETIIPYCNDRNLGIRPYIEKIVRNNFR